MEFSRTFFWILLEKIFAVSFCSSCHDAKRRPISSRRLCFIHDAFNITMSCRLLLTRISTKNKHCSFSTSAGERLRVAVVGGGCAGLSSALHLAPLVERGLIASPIDVFEPSKSKGRDIGVGLWSTGIEPWRVSQRSSHQMLWQDLMHYGTFITNVGYREPKGTWLAKSQLPGEISDDMDNPALLFLREHDMLAALNRAAHLEEHQGTIQMHGGDSSRITGIVEDSPYSYSSNLVGAVGNVTDRDYHLIVAADGTYSMLRQKYAGHRRLKRLTGTAAIDESQQFEKALDDSSWEAMGQAEANAVEDRKYTVFRGNSSISNEQAGDTSFQTWGTGKSMRFAEVPMSYPSGENKRVEKHVWFITTSDDSIAAEEDPVKRRDLLLDAFKGWHSPVCEIVETTPPEEILHERAVAHRHYAPPVMNVNSDLKQYGRKRTNSNGPGPALVYIGDAFMTIDPILAQGFTMAMESASQLGDSVERGTLSGSNQGNLAFDPYIIRKELLDRFDRRSDRLLACLRATELVQAMGQPSSGVTGLLSRGFVRPAMKLSPDFVKTPMFNAVLRYSLGLPLRASSS